jgi:hypothetical protein
MIVSNAEIDEALASLRSQGVPVGKAFATAKLSIVIHTMNYLVPDYQLVRLMKAGKQSPEGIRGLAKEMETVNCASL